jgi:hypothetical protein
VDRGKTQDGKCGESLVVVEEKKRQRDDVKNNFCEDDDFD